MKEIWRPIKGFEGYYEVSNRGRVKSLKRKYRTKEIILRPGINSRGYPMVMLCKNTYQQTIKVHKLVWEAFGEKLKGEIVDHIDGNTLNSSIENLQKLSQRENTSKGWRNKKASGLPTGVSFHKPTGRYRASIRSDNINYHLGLFDSIVEAKRAYNKRLKELLADGKN